MIDDAVTRRRWRILGVLVLSPLVGRAPATVPAPRLRAAILEEPA